MNKECNCSNVLLIDLLKENRIMSEGYYRMLTLIELLLSDSEIMKNEELRKEFKEIFENSCY